MATMDELFDAFEAVLLSRPGTSPWSKSGGAAPEFTPDYEALTRLIGIPIEAGSGSETGRLAKAIDAWAANELRRAGFDGDEVWPRASKPRILPRDLALLLRGLPEKERGAVKARILKNKKIPSTRKRVVGPADWSVVRIARRG